MPGKRAEGPKKRWTTAERAARGKAPRKGGGVRSNDRFGDRKDRFTDRGAESTAPRSGHALRADQADRPSRPARDNAKRVRSSQPYEARSSAPRGRFDRDDRPARSFDRPDRGDRPARSFDRPDRGNRIDRPDRPARSFDRPDRGGRSERPARSFDRPDRGDRIDRPDRPARSFDRPDRDRADRGDRNDRPARSFDRPDRGDRNDRFGDRPARTFDREDRPKRSFDRDDRPTRSFDREDRPKRSFDRDDRPTRSFDREERPARSFDRDRPDRGDRSDRNDRPARSYERPARDERPSRSYDRPERSERPDRDRDRDDRPARSYDRPERNDRPARSYERPERVETPTAEDAFDRAARTDRFDRPESETEIDAPLVTPSIDEEAAVSVPLNTDTTFADLNLPPALVSALNAQGILTPFAIQAATIPDALAGRDVLGRGRTGSGKTLAFGLPMITRLSDGARASAPRGIVLVPTRELAMQVHDALAPLAATSGLSLILIAGGMSYTPQLRAFQRGVDIVIATPGRLIDLMDQGAADLTRVEVTVLDEADHMADLGFMPAVTQILDTVPANGQRLLFSATLDGAVNRLVRSYLTDPVTHEVDSGQASITTMAHHLVHVAPKDKALVTAQIARRDGRTVVFVRTQLGADRVSEQLREAGVMAGSLHGGLPQGARTRILAAFKDGHLPVLVATDVAARGIHVDEVGLVLQVDPPGGPKEYLHRAGRTARAGDSGTVVTLVLPHQRRELSRLTHQAGVKAVELPGQPGDPALAAATGALGTIGDPISEGDYQRVIAPPQKRRHPGSGDRAWGRGSGGGGGNRRFGRDDRGGRGGREDRPGRSDRRPRTV